MHISKTNRRDFLKVSAVAGGGLMLNLNAAQAAGNTAPSGLNAYIKIAPDGDRKSNV